MGADFVAFPTFGGMFGKRKVDFLIIGAQKCGTSSLYQYLTENLMVNSAVKKEVHFFDFNWEKSTNWYHNHFDFEKGKITGEASPYYLFHPEAAKRVRNYNSKIKLIAILRNPIDRAISQYLMNVERGTENLTFSEAIRAEEERTANQKPDERGNNFQQFSYKKRGCYYEQLKQWQLNFSRAQIYVINFDTFFHNPQFEIQKVYNFLEVVPYFGNNKTIIKNTSKNTLSPSKEDILFLKTYFKEDNTLLDKHFSINFE